MRIDTSEQLEGIPLPEIRAAFREVGLDGVILTDFIHRRFRLSKAQADRLIASLRRQFVSGRQQPPNRFGGRRLIVFYQTCWSALGS
jgi:hypothetical protein